MSLKPHLELMARYNLWMNQKILDTIKDVDEATLWADRGAFFGSIMATLNHILGADLLWLKRFEPFDHMGILKDLNQYPIPTALNSIGYDRLSEFAPARQSLDHLIIDFIACLRDETLNGPITYVRINGEAYTKSNAGLVLSHVFNHQTHHRGQVTTLLSQMGLDVGVTDLVVLAD